ncbi:MAG: hypothetical protein ACD_49C00032G0001 [uncultured bacterium (gcode 4)]|uniref:Uncharacterized protein n=1 Tax=uncultured bacterium (gcode 4) TaxID=1234023 RepID=K2AXU6_9BACT|nr:MAG: hypothetical protein ACD_49C00032G0001 [uncultured bacterium (gcode 4)]
MGVVFHFLGFFASNIFWIIHSISLSQDSIAISKAVFHSILAIKTSTQDFINNSTIFIFQGFIACINAVYQFSSKSLILISNLNNISISFISQFEAKYINKVFHHSHFSLIFHEAKIFSNNCFSDSLSEFFSLSFINFLIAKILVPTISDLIFPPIWNNEVASVLNNLSSDSFINGLKRVLSKSIIPNHFSLS